jgi:alkylation response protein AidB-like acyl-CoA dehydrogenase
MRAVCFRNNLGDCILKWDANVAASTYIEFDDVEVPLENLVGTENEGFPIIMSSTVHP